MTKNIQPLKGFRDFLPAEALKRKWLKQKLVTIFEQWGFDPMETPTLEPLELFEGQIGEDEKLFYKFQDNGGRNVAMRYDQTVPTCRVVGTNYQTLPMPFKRYQIQPAFRAENTQKGRYREFVQCDADIFGVLEPWADAEIISLSLDIYIKLGFENPRILISDRALLKDFPYEAIVAIDKLEKIGEKGVIEDMKSKGIDETTGLNYLKKIQDLQPNETLIYIFKYLKDYGFSEKYYAFEPKLARSFSYSSGPIWEVKIPEIGNSSVLGGERFDKLIEQISGIQIPGTGFGLGFDRTLEACESLGILPNILTTTQILVSVFSPELSAQSQLVTTKLREKGFKVELYSDFKAKLEKQLKYALKKGIQYFVILGPEEVEKNLITIKNLNSKEQKTDTLEKVFELINT